MPNLTTNSTPLSSALRFYPLPFRGAQSYEVFCSVKPPHGLTLRGTAKLRLSWHLQVPTLKEPFRPQGSAKVRKFSPRQAPLPLPPTLLFDRTAKVRSFDIHKCRPVPSLPYPFVKDHAKSHNQTLPCHHPPHLLPLLFFRERKVTNFLPLSSPPSRPLPQDTANYGLLGIRKCPI